ncbi:hypothetical protein PCYB_032960 [Plasmodium cynomolgi strain B]|nr:hypothetical protein PCYB_032960 [Plasmodium cynomolgi strain B]GAB64885.1 hypothetical protein PCYB_032960 [Plasmodium cynomolgi strain B]
MNGSLCLRKIFLCSIFVLVYLSSAKCAYRDGSDILYSEDSTYDLAINEASTNSYESLAASIESLTASSESLAAGSESLAASSESLTGSSESLTASSESLTASSESLAAGSESLTESSESIASINESLNDFYGSEELISCEGEPNKKRFIGDVLRDGISEDDLLREDLFHVQEGSEEMLNDVLKNHSQKDLSTSENSLFEDDQSLKSGFRKNCSETSLDSYMGSFKNGRSRHGLDIDSDPHRRPTHGGNEPQGEEKSVNFKEHLGRQRNQQRNSVNIKLKNFYGEEKMYNSKKNRFIIKFMYYLPFVPIVAVIIILMILLLTTPKIGLTFLLCSPAVIAAFIYVMYSNRKQFKRTFGTRR